MEAQALRVYESDYVRDSSNDGSEYDDDSRGHAPDASDDEESDDDSSSIAIKGYRVKAMIERVFVTAAFLESSQSSS